MKTQKWTPGPWRRGQTGNLRIYGPDATREHTGMLAEVCPKNGDGAANAALIAKAPEMAESLLSVIGDESISCEIPAVLIANIKRILREAGAL